MPASLPAVCRVLHPWRNSADRPDRWEDVAASQSMDRPLLAKRLIDAMYQRGPRLDQHLGEPVNGQLDADTAARLTRHLEAKADVYLALWEGFGDEPQRQFPGAARIRTDRRGYVLLQGSIDALGSIDRFGAVRGIWWPLDRTWLVHTEIDYHWTFVAGPQELIDALAADPALEAIVEDFDTPANHLGVPLAGATSTDSTGQNGQ